jgi:DNA gyrase inhibitor GyrI
MAPRVKIEQIQSYKVASVKARSGSPEDIADAWARLISWLGSGRALAKTEVGGGIGIIHNKAGARGHKYEAAWPLDGAARGTKDVKIGETPAGTYAVLRHKGDLRRIDDSIAVVVDEWLPKSGYEQDKGPILTLHRNSLKVRHPDKQVVDVCVPVKQAGKKKR